MDVAVSDSGMVVIAYHRDNRVYVQYQPGSNEVDVVQEMIDQGLLTVPPAPPGWESYLDELSDVRCAFKGDNLQLIVESKPLSFWVSRDAALGTWTYIYFTTPV